MPVYLIVFEAEGGPFFDEFIDKIQRFTHHKQIFGNGWLIDTPKASSELLQSLEKFFNPNDEQILISRVATFLPLYILAFRDQIRDQTIKHEVGIIK